MKVGITLPMSASDGPGRMPGWADVLALARHAESAGLDSVWVCDHLLSEPGDASAEGVLEPGRCWPRWPLRPGGSPSAPS